MSGHGILLGLWLWRTIWKCYGENSSSEVSELEPMVGRQQVPRAIESKSEREMEWRARARDKWRVRGVPRLGSPSLFCVTHIAGCDGYSESSRMDP
jgi:hypothetical protein